MFSAHEAVVADSDHITCTAWICHVHAATAYLQELAVLAIRIRSVCGKGVQETRVFGCDAGNFQCWAAWHPGLESSRLLCIQGCQLSEGYI